MALIRCEQCGKEISDTMNACPFCGNTRQKEETSAPFRVADLKTEENKPLMREICITVCSLMAACVGIRLLLSLLYEKTVLFIIGDGICEYPILFTKSKFYSIHSSVYSFRLRLG